MPAYAIENYSNVIQFEVVQNKNKYKMDDTIKKTPNNCSEERWVDPIREKDKVLECAQYLLDKTLSAKRADTQRACARNLLLFIIGINVGLRVSDLIKLKWSNIFMPDMHTFVEAKNKGEQKTGKMKIICPNEPIKKVINDYLLFTGIVPEAKDYIFLSGRRSSDGTFHHITDAAVEKMMKNISLSCGLPGNYNTHSLRKTYAYHKYMMYVRKGDPMALIKVQKDLNHRNTSDTARYLGITRDEQINSSMELGDYWGL